MNTNIPIAAAFTLLIVLFIYSCTTTPSKIDERDLRDYPTGKSYDTTSEHAVIQSKN